MVFSVILRHACPLNLQQWRPWILVEASADVYPTPAVIALSVFLYTHAEHCITHKHLLLNARLDSILFKLISRSLVMDALSLAGSTSPHVP